MSFYTNVLRYKNNILYRGYSDNGDRVIKKEHYKPKFYVTSNTKTKFKNLILKSDYIQNKRNIFEKYIKKFHILIF